MAPPAQMPVFGRYRLERKLARGGMADVYLAHFTGPMGFSRPVALKKIRADLLEKEPEMATMFLSEARTSALLTHSNIAQLYDFGEENGVLYIAMELIEGPHLKQVIRDARKDERYLPIPVVVELVRQVCEGLGYAHSLRDRQTGASLGLVHRDVTPDNLIVSREGLVKLIDFGIARSDAQAHQTQPGVVKGKVLYMSPEQLRGEQLDHRSDIFSLGLVLQELLTLEHPFARAGDAATINALLFEELPKPSSRRPDVPPQLDEIVQRATEKEPGRRYPVCSELRADLSLVLRTMAPGFGTHDLVALWGTSPARKLTPAAPAAAAPPPRSITAPVPWVDDEPKTIQELAPTLPPGPPPRRGS